MKKIFTTFATCILLIGCGKGNDESGSSNVQKNSGMFSGSVAGNEYKVEVSCSYLDKDYFQFKSDKTDISDTNGDGIIISGMETSGKFTLTIIDNGKTFSVGNLSNFTKGDNKAEGSGKLFEEGTADAHDVQFSVICG
jgi:hypothetical protein